MPTPTRRSGEPRTAASADTYVVRDVDADRLDRFLAQHWPGCSRRLARLAIAGGAVLVNGRRGRKGQSLQPGDTVLADRRALQSVPAAQPELAVTLLYEDAAVIAVDKPAGMPSVARRADDRGTIVNYLIARYPELAAIGGAFEAGLAHRLDTATSGVLVAGRTDAAWHRLRAQFRRRVVDKLYIAVVQGRVRHRGTVALPIAHRPRRAREMSVCVDPDRAHALGARPALTYYRCLRRQRDATLLAIRIPTGVRHQIRVHLASIGHPVLGDALYGDGAAAPRLMLHAARIAFAHPSDGRRVIIRSRLPDDFQAVLRSLGM